MTEPTPDMVRHAADWHAALSSGEATEADFARCSAWQSEHPAQAEAFRRIERIMGRLDGLPPGPAREALRAGGVASRQARRLIAGGAVLGLLVPLALASADWPWITADYHTGTGEIAERVLPDGTRVTLASNSAIRIDYDRPERRIQLVRGEIMLDVARDPVRPLMVETAQGSLQALGTRFAVRRGESGADTDVIVEESSVEACAAGGNCLVLKPGDSAHLRGHHVEGPVPVPADATAWTRGLLVADAMPLAQVLAELSRYHAGFLRYDASRLADLRVSGVFPLRDTATALTALSAALPIEVHRYTGFFLAVERR